MKLALKDFQVEAVDRLRLLSAKASEDAAEDDPQSLVLPAPTGSGKTVMAAAWMERVLGGDEERPPDSDATFLC